MLKTILKIRDQVDPSKLLYAKQLRRNMTTAEKILWERLRRKQLGCKFRKQSIIRGYIVDFYCPEKKLVIEADGSSHDNRIAYDKRRDNHLKKIGFKTLRFTNEEILNSIEHVITAINNELGA